MKIDRLLGITIYLLNHGVVSASVLAEEFEVSVRTILRDVESLSLSGIPITSLYGSCGGYKILENYKLTGQLMDDEDYSYILTALQGLKTGLHNKGIQETFQKLLHTADKKKMKQNIFLDFSVMHEGSDMDEYMKRIEQSIHNSKIIEFEYTNSSGYASTKQVDPIALQYRWYAWYLLGYCHTGQAYRWYKVIRMRNLTETGASVTLQHETAERLIDRLLETDNQTYINMKLKCDSKIKVPVQEYLRGDIISENKDSFILSLKEPAKDRMWYSLLMGFGSAIEVLEPDFLREQLKDMANEIYNLYNV